MHTKYYGDSQSHPFYLGRHGQSMLNAGEKSQGKAQGRGDLPWNGLTDKGREQARSIYPALNAAGVSVAHVSSSQLIRARETAIAFIDSHPYPKPVIEEVFIQGLEEVSQEGWEMEFTRAEIMNLREDSLNKEIERLKIEGLSPDLEGYVAWTAVLGKNGESPLTAALRGIKALEDYGVKPNELIISHAMLNRYMDAIATRIDSANRSFLREMHSDTLGAQEKIAVLNALSDLGLPPYNADDTHNKVANGGITEYRIDFKTGIWIVGRRIEPPKPFESTAFVEYSRKVDGVWVRVKPLSEELKPL